MEEMNKVQEWELTKEVFARFLAKRNWLELIELGEMLTAQMDYEAKKRDSFLNRDKFSEFMSEQW